VTGILEDERGDLWLATNNGLSQFNPRNRTFRNYYASTLVGQRVLRRQSRLEEPPRGDVLLFLYRLTSFFPNYVEDNPYIPRVLTDFQIFGKPGLSGASLR